MTTTTQPEVHDEQPHNQAGVPLCSGGCGFPAARADRTGRGVRKGDVLKYAKGHRDPKVCAEFRATHLGTLVEALREARRGGLLLAEARRRLDAPRALVDDAVRQVREEEDAAVTPANPEEAAKANRGKVGGRQPKAKRGKPRAGRTLSDDQVREVRRLRAEESLSYRKIGARVGCDDQTAWLIVHRRSRADVPDVAEAVRA
jgi:hypothetical protein